MHIFKIFFLNKLLLFLLTSPSVIKFILPFFSFIQTTPNFFFVISANAGGAFSPFGDITTLMVWQKGIIQFQTFFVLFLPSLVNWLIPAAIMHFALPDGNPDPMEEKPQILDGAWVIVGLFIVTIILAVSFHQFLHLPPVLGMMTGLGLLKMFGYFLANRVIAHGRHHAR